jgi:hypothetical protein
MNTTTASTISRFVRRVGQIWSELDYAQRRLLELRTGVPDLTRRERGTSPRHGSF